MKITKIITTIAVLGASQAVQAVTVSVGDSTTAWNGYMNVFELPANGGASVFGSGWGLGDLATSFDDPNETITFSPNTIGDPDPFWYQGGGAPGNPGNKSMEANLYYQNDGGLAGQTVDFKGTIDAFTLTGSHVLQVFVRDFASDFSSSVDSFVTITAAGPFSVSLATINDPLRHVQYGFQMKGENVWVTDVAPFGSAVISSAPVPEPSSTLLSLVGLAFVARRRR
ncbi:MAG: PEP-CTERM sorting domain-containing protein [Akkermansiaceae bacterium]|nr:PEP-CTERM sorting domain-containing protein [Akkermansiaceae bacterium]